MTKTIKLNKEKPIQNEKDLVKFFKRKLNEMFDSLNPFGENNEYSDYQFQFNKSIEMFEKLFDEKEKIKQINDKFHELFKDLYPKYNESSMVAEGKYYWINKFKEFQKIIKEFLDIDTIQNPNFIKFELEKIQEKYKEMFK